MSVQQWRKYDPDYKRNAALFSDEEDRKVTEVAENLSISTDFLYRCRREYRSSKVVIKFISTRLLPAYLFLFDRYPNLAIILATTCCKVHLKLRPIIMLIT